MVYYICNSGDDRLDGLSPETAWQTTENLFHRIQGGDTVLLRCGDTFYGSIQLPDGVDSEHRTTLSCYGNGDKPKICLYKVVLKSEAWEEVSPLIWRINLENTECYDGNVFTIDTNVGFLNVNGVIHGDKRFVLSELRNYWQFYCEAPYVYVCSNRNPQTYADTIGFAIGNGIRLGNHSAVYGVDVFGGGCHGITGSVCDAVISGCDIHHFGGSHLTTDPRTHVRFGNGVEFWCGGRDILVEDNRIYHIYDVGVTMQGYPVPHEGWQNVIFRNNTFWGNEQTFEIWTHNQNGGEGIRSCAFQNNLCIDAGYGWSHNVRPDKDAGVHLLLYATLCPQHDILVEGNVFCNPRTALYYKSHGEPDGKIPNDYVTKKNRLYLRKDAFLINRSMVYEASDFKRFQEERQKEIDSDLYWIAEREDTVEERMAMLSQEQKGGE